MRQEIGGMQREVKLFSTIARQVFAKHQASGFRTYKFHALHYLADDLMDVENMHVLHARLYESSNRVFKTFYRRKSKRTATAIEEVLRLQNMADDGKSKTLIFRQSFPMTLQIQQSAVTTNGGRLIAIGFYGIFCDIARARRVRFKNEVWRSMKNGDITRFAFEPPSDR